MCGRDNYQVLEIDRYNALVESERNLNKTRKRCSNLGRCVEKLISAFIAENLTPCQTQVGCVQLDNQTCILEERREHIDGWCLERPELKTCWDIWRENELSQ